MRRAPELSPPMRTRVDSTDLVQAVWASFFAMPFQKYSFDSPNALLAFLITLA